MNVDLGIWSKLSRAIVFLLIVACLMGVAAWYWPVVQTNERMRKEILRINREVRAEDEQARKLKAEIDALQHDPKTVERQARESLGYAKPDETIIRFEESAPGTNPPARRP
jgi:cell division protein FtsB